MVPNRGEGSKKFPFPVTSTHDHITASVPKFIYFYNSSFVVLILFSLSTLLFLEKDELVILVKIYNFRLVFHLNLMNDK